MGGYDGHRGWLYAVAVLEPHRLTGLGARLVREAEQRLEELGCSKINLQVRSSNTEVTGFYEALGYQSGERVSMGKTPERSRRERALRVVWRRPR